MENKFNFSDEENLDKSVSRNAKGLFQSLFSFFKKFLILEKKQIETTQ